MQFHLVTSLLFVLFFLLLKKKKKIEREYHLTFTCIIRYGRICPFSIHTHTQSIFYFYCRPNILFILCVCGMSFFCQSIESLSKLNWMCRALFFLPHFILWINQWLFYDSWFVWGKNEAIFLLLRTAQTQLDITYTYPRDCYISSFCGVISSRNVIIKIRITRLDIAIASYKCHESLTNGRRQPLRSIQPN